MYRLRNYNSSRCAGGCQRLSGRGRGILFRRFRNSLLWNFSVKYLHLQQIFSNFAPESVVSCQETAVDCVNMTAKENINGGSKGLRGNRSFLATFNALYLAVPDILLTHTRTVADLPLKNVRIRARMACRNPGRQRASHEFPLSAFPCPSVSSGRGK